MPKPGKIASRDTPRTRVYPMWTLTKKKEHRQFIEKNNFEFELVGEIFFWFGFTWLESPLKILLTNKKTIKK